MFSSRSAEWALGSSGALLLLVTLGGCGGAASRSEREPSLPTTIHAEGKTWSLEQGSADQDPRVVAYFSQNPGLVDHSVFGGKEARYADGQGNLRYFWVSVVGSSWQWIMLKCDGSRAFEFVEGEGEPFLRSST